MQGWPKSRLMLASNEQLSLLLFSLIAAENLYFMMAHISITHLFKEPAISMLTQVLSY
jgi:hypothetical protein